ncbi:MAG: hypothetical protein R3F19_16660 [Verrucomicrobiales bacterium]|nr:hypothetical protein [Verrucomicrobiae bacterium]
MNKLFKALAAAVLTAGVIALVSCSSPAPTPAPVMDGGAAGGGYMSSK